MHSAECSRDSRRILVGLLVGRFGARILYTSKSKVTSYFFQLFQYCVAVYSRLSAQTWPTSRNPFFYIPFHRRDKPALCLKSVSTRVSVVAPKSEHVRMIHAWTGHKLSKRFKLAARGKRRKRKKKGHQVSLLMNNAASMNLLSANRWSPRPAAAFLLPERPSVVTRNRIFLRFYLCAESFHANTRSRSMRACKTEEEEGAGIPSLRSTQEEFISR